jgi:putative tryptophan/tyrosine transport system substrate-binding protein
MTACIGRRDFITLLGGAAATWPLTVRAQQPAMPVIGYLNSTSPNTYAIYTDAFRQGLRSIGYVEGENIAITYRWAEGHNDRLPALAADLVSHQVAAIAATGATASAVAAKAATRTIPIVFITGGDPVEFKLVDSLNRPGGNLTGVNFLANSLGSKQLELLHQLVPGPAPISVLVNPTNPTLADELWRDAEAAARSLGMQVRRLHASTERDFAMIFQTLAQVGAGALLIGVDGFFTSRVGLLAQLTVEHAVPAMYFSRGFPVAGGLISYGTSLLDAYRQVGVYTGKVLRGEKPADLPVVQPTKFEFVINLKTAKKLGLTVPLALQVAADEAIE